MTTPTFYQEYRCPNDEKLLFRGLLVDSEVEVKCRNCKQLITLKGQAANTLVCKKINCPNRV